MDRFARKEPAALEGVYDFLRLVTEPVLGPLRRALPPLRVGGMGLDLSPLVALLGIQILHGIICG